MPMNSQRRSWALASVLLLVIFTCLLYSMPFRSDQTWSASPTTLIHTPSSTFNHRIRNPDEILPQLPSIHQLPLLSVAEARRTCTWNAADEQHMQWTFNEPEWLKEEPSIAFVAQTRRQWLSFLAAGLQRWSSVKHHFGGRGIVTVAGNHDTIKRVAVLLRQLKRLKSKLPVEIHYWKEEVTAKDKAVLESIGPRLL